MPPLLLLVPLALLSGGEDSAATWVDVDRDGALDLFLPDAEDGDRLLVARGQSGFVDRIADSGLAARRGSRVAVWADYDADGWPDLYRVDARGSGEVWRNMGDGTFAPVGEFAGVPPARGVIEARWLDLEGDGDLDLALWTEEALTLARGNGDGTFVTTHVSRTGAASGAASGERVPTRATPVEAETPVEGGGSAPLGVPTTTITPGGAPPRQGASAAAKCPVALDDQALFGSCLQASSAPVLGMLYPLSSELFVSAGGNIGLGTTVPGERLDVVGTIETDGLRMPTGASQGRVLTTDGAGNASWQPSPITGLTGGGTTYYLPRYTSPGTLGDSVIRETTTGQIAIGTTNSTATLGVAGDVSNRAVRLVGSGTNGSGAKLLFGEDNDTYLAETAEDSLDIGANGMIGMGPGNVGVHLTDPAQATHSLNVGPSTGLGPDVLRLIGPVGLVGYGAKLSFGDADYAVIEEDQDDRLRIRAAQGTQIETSSLQTVPALRVEQTVGAGTSSPALHLRNTSLAQGIGVFSETFGGDANAVFTNYGGGSLIKCFASGLKFEVRNDGRVVCNQLEITGGSDLAEPFETAAPVEPGTVMVIDPEHAGALRASSEPYDARVAGVVSGAGDIQAGLSLRQEGVTEGETPVALTGRVYVRCSAENGPVSPGDLLTTATTPGHAMRASDRERSFGAVLGKAMGHLDEGTGLVLMLVNLQ